MKRTATSVVGLMSLVALLVLGVFSAGAAQAHTFLWTGALPGLLLALSDGPQFFRFTEGGAAFTCKHARFHGVVTKESSETQKVVGQYSKCEAIGSELIITPVEYELSANETVSIVNKTVQLSIPVAKCTIDIEPSARNQALSKIRYLIDPNSVGTRLLLHAEVEKLHSIILGGAGLCGPEGLHTDGLYRGLLLAWVHGSGTLSWT